MKNKLVLGLALTLLIGSSAQSPTYAAGDSAHAEADQAKAVEAKTGESTGTSAASSAPTSIAPTNIAPTSTEPRPALPQSDIIVPDKIDPSKGMPDDTGASVTPTTISPAATSSTPAAPLDLSQDESAGVMQAKPADKDIFKVTMTAPTADVAAAIKARYEAYAKVNLAAKSFDDLDPFVCKDLRERSKNIKQAIYESPKVKNRPEKEKEEAYCGMFQFINMMMPRYATVTGIKAKGDVAIITVVSRDVGALGEGLMKGMTGMMTGMVNGMAQGVAGVVPGAKKPTPIKAPAMKMPTMAGKIYMQKEDGQWNFAGEDFKQVFTPEELKKQAEEKAKGEWCAQAVKMPLSQKPVTGMLHGSKFVMRNAKYSSGVLSLRSGTEFFPDLALEIFIFGIDNNRPDGQTIVMQNNEKKDDKSCHVHMEWKKPGAKGNESKTYFDMDKLGLKLQFGQRKDSKLPGFINLRLPDAAHSNVQGYFWADMQ